MMYLRGLVTLYSWRLPARLMGAVIQRRYRASAYLRWFWFAKDLRTEADFPGGSTAWIGAIYLGIGMVAEIACGIALLINWARFGTAGNLAFGVAFVVGYPVVWALLLAVGAAFYRGLYLLFVPKSAERPHPRPKKPVAKRKRTRT